MDENISGSEVAREAVCESRKRMESMRSFVEMEGEGRFEDLLVILDDEEDEAA